MNNLQAFIWGTEIRVRDARIRTLDRIVQEVKQSEEWEDIKMDLYAMGVERGREYGRREGMKKGLARGHREGRLEGIRAVISLCRQMGLAEQETEKKLQEQFSLSEEEAREEVVKRRVKE